MMVNSSYRHLTDENSLTVALSVDHINYLLSENNEPSEPKSGTVLNNFKAGVVSRVRYLCVQIELLLDK